MPRVFGSEQEQIAYNARVEAARRSQRFRYAVAPGGTLHVSRGVLREGDEVTVDDLIDPLHPETYPSSAMARLVADGVVLEATPEQLRAANVSPTARYVAARALTSNRGIVAPGEELTPSDVAGGQAQLELLVSKGLVIDRHAPARGGGPGQAA